MALHTYWLCILGPRSFRAVQSVGDTTFGPVAEGARRQDVRSNEADVKSKHGDARLVGPRVGRRRHVKTGRHKRPDEKWSVDPHGLRRSGRRGPPGVVGLFWAIPYAGFTLPTVKRFSPTSGICKPAVNRRKPLETARNDNSNSKTGNRCLPTGNRCLPTGNRRF